MSDLKRVKVWSGWLRIAHWALAGAVLVLLGSFAVILVLQELFAWAA